MYHKLMSNMLNQRWALAKLRAELEERKRRICRKCERFGHLAQKYRSREEQKKEKAVGNRFEVLKNYVIQCRVREVRRQEVVRDMAKCFEYGQEGHKKWECPQKKRRVEEEAAPL